MDAFFQVLTQLLRAFIRLALVALGGVFLLAIVSVVFLVTLLMVVWSLVTGRKPALFTTFSAVRQASQRFRAGGRFGMGQTRPADAVDAEVVDVQAREVPRTPPPRIE